jgi:hypothetical protein
MPFMTANSFVGLGIEGTRGTASSNVKFVPVTGPQVTPMQKWLRDDAFRSSPVDNYGEILGVRHDEYDIKGYVFADTFPVLVKGALGYEASTGSGPYTHTLSLYNNAANASQPPAITVQDFDGDQTFQILAGQVGDLNVTFTAEGALEYDAKLFGNPFTKISNPTTSFSTEVFIPAWDLSMTIGGNSTAVTATGDINIKRNTAPIFTAQGVNSPYRLFAGPIDVSGKFTFVLEASDPILYNGSSNGYGLTAGTQAVVLTFTDPVSSHTVKFQMSAVQFENPKRTRGKAYVEVETEFMAVANTTDAVSGAGGGYAPIQIVATNGVSTTY